MIDFDSNLIIFKKIFDVPEIYDIYKRTKIFNPLLPKYYYQLKLFELNQYSHDLGLFLGCEQIENIYVYWFLDQINAKLYPFKTIADTIYLPKKFILHKQNTSLDKFNYVKLLPLNIISYTPISILKKEYCEEWNLTIERFLSEFNSLNLVIRL